MILLPLPGAMVVLAVAMVLLGSRTVSSDGKILFSVPPVIVRVVVPSAHRNTMTLAVPGRAVRPPSDLSTFLSDIFDGVAYHPDLGAFNNYIDTSICFDSGMALSALESPWRLVDLRVESQVSTCFSVRAEMKENLYSIGAGVRIKGLEMSCSFHSLGFAERAVSGLSLEGVIRW